MLYVDWDAGLRHLLSCFLQKLFCVQCITTRPGPVQEAEDIDRWERMPGASQWKGRMGKLILKPHLKGAAINVPQL